LYLVFIFGYDLILDSADPQNPQKFKCVHIIQNR